MRAFQKLQGQLLRSINFQMGGEPASSRPTEMLTMLTQAYSSEPMPVCSNDLRDLLLTLPRPTLLALPVLKLHLPSQPWLAL